MTNFSNVTITDNARNKVLVVSCEAYDNNLPIFKGVIGKRMINKLIANNINFTLIEG